MTVILSMQYKIPKTVRIQTADGVSSAAHSIVMTPLRFSNGQIADVPLVVLPRCPCGILLGPKAVENIVTSTGTTVNNTIREVLADIDPTPKNY